MCIIFKMSSIFPPPAADRSGEDIPDSLLEVRRLPGVDGEDGGEADLANDLPQLGGVEVFTGMVGAQHGGPSCRSCRVCRVVSIVDPLGEIYKKKLWEPMVA